MTNALLPALLLVLTTFWPQSATAERSSGLEYKYLSKDIPAKEAQALLQQSDKDSAPATAKRLAAQVERLQTIAKITEPPRQAFLDALKGDRRYADYQKLLNAIADNPRLSAEAKYKALTELAYAQEKLVESAYAKAAIDEDLYHRYIGRKFPEAKRGENLTILHHGEEHTEEIPEEPQPTELVLDAPYPIDMENTVTQGLNVAGEIEVEASMATGSLDIINDIAFGEASALVEAGVGDFVQVPAGLSRVDLTVELDITYFRLIAFSIGAVTGASAEARIEIDGPQVDQEESEELGSVFAPVAWLAQMEGEDAVLLNTSFTPAASGGLYQIMAIVSTFGYIVGFPGADFSLVEYDPANVKEIRVNFIP